LTILLDQFFSVLAARSTQRALLASLALLLVACSDSVTDDVIDDIIDQVTDDDDSVAIGPTNISGRIIAVDRVTGIELPEEDYVARARKVIVYVLEDPTDLSNIIGKVTLDGPGEWRIEDIEHDGPIFAIAVVMQRWDVIVGSSDITRYHPFNPIHLNGGELTDIDITLDIPQAWTGGDGGGGVDHSGTNSSHFLGTVVTSTLADQQIIVTCNGEGFSSGPWHGVSLDGFGPFDLSCGDHHGTSTSILAYHDTDGNGLFEPSDAVGPADGNPYVLGLDSPTAGITIELPSATSVPIPAPPPYQPIIGEVLFGDFNPSGDILVFASHATPEGPIFSGIVMDAPGAFGLVAPAGSPSVMVWAVFDAEGDGEYDISLDPFDSVGPADMNGGELAQVQLDLGGSSDSQLGSVGGLVLHNGPVGPDDVLYIALASEVPTPSSSPDLSIVVSNPSFPVQYNFSDIETGTWWVTGYLDVGGDSPPATNPGGAAGDRIGMSDVILVAPGEDDTGNDFTLEN